jgi:peptide/nickel transport system ATP-binding protein
MIALALVGRPKVLLADEPTTALDATVQVQILLLLRDLQRELGLSMIFVTHDISVAVEVADRIAVMYAGRIVETGPIRDVIRAPRHPYTIGLLSTRAHGGRLTGKRLPAIPGSPPDLANLPPGCAFAPRCALAADVCKTAPPEPVTLSPGHVARCYRTADTVDRSKALHGAA